MQTEVPTLKEMIARLDEVAASLETEPKGRLIVWNWDIALFYGDGSRWSTRWLQEKSKSFGTWWLLMGRVCIGLRWRRDGRGWQRIEKVLPGSSNHDGKRLCLLGCGHKAMAYARARDAQCFICTE